MMTSQILKSLDFTQTQKSRYLESETFFLQKNQKNPLITNPLNPLKSINNSFAVKVSFKITVAKRDIEFFNFFLKKDLGWASTNLYNFATNFYGI